MTPPSPFKSERINVPQQCSPVFGSGLVVLWYCGETLQGLHPEFGSVGKLTSEMHAVAPNIPETELHYKRNTTGLISNVQQGIGAFQNGFSRVANTMLTPENWD